VFNTLLHWLFKSKAVQVNADGTFDPNSLGYFFEMSGQRWMVHKQYLLREGFLPVGPLHAGLDRVAIARYADAQLLGRFLFWLRDVQYRFYGFAWRRGFLSTPENEVIQFFKHFRFPPQPPQ
jgi:hypothetical protein